MGNVRLEGELLAGLETAQLGIAWQVAQTMGGVTAQPSLDIDLTSHASQRKHTSRGSRTIGMLNGQDTSGIGVHKTLSCSARAWLRR